MKMDCRKFKLFSNKELHGSIVHDVSFNFYTKVVLKYIFFMCNLLKFNVVSCNIYMP